MRLPERDQLSVTREKCIQILLQLAEDSRRDNFWTWQGYWCFLRYWYGNKNGKKHGNQIWYELELGTMLAGENECFQRSTTVKYVWESQKVDSEVKKIVDKGYERQKLYHWKNWHPHKIAKDTSLETLPGDEIRINTKIKNLQDHLKQSKKKIIKKPRFRTIGKTKACSIIND